MAVVAQYVFRPNPGADLPAVIANVKEAAALWRKYGAEVHLWTVSMGEIGNMAFSAHFDSYESYARCMDRLITDGAFLAWQQKNLAIGLASWVRSNLAREIPI
jgi:hypothetical protein